MWQQIDFRDIHPGDTIRWKHPDGEILDCGRAKGFIPGRHYDTWEMEDGHELYGFQGTIERLQGPNKDEA